jgi:hypothetical protein
VPSSPVVFVFDTNAHSYIADREDFDKIVGKLKNRDQPLIPQLTFINFFEYLKLVKDDASLKRAQDYVRKLKAITLGGSILPLAELHVQYTAGLIGRERLETDVRTLLKNMNTFLKMQSFADFKDLFEPSLEKDIARISEIVAGYEGMKEPTLEVLREFREQKKVDDFKRWLSLKAQREYLETFTERAIRRFGLSFSQFSNNIDVVFRSLPSVRYYVAVYLHYVKQLTLGKRKPKPSDYIDLEQVVYLNVADYLVTRDGFLRDLINNSGEPDLKGRAISPREFIAMLGDTHVEPRAPDSCRRLRVVRMQANFITLHTN